MSCCAKSKISNQWDNQDRVISVGFVVIGLSMRIINWSATLLVQRRLLCSCEPRWNLRYRLKNRLGAAALATAGAWTECMQVCPT